MFEICDKNLSNGKYEALRDCLFKMKRIGSKLFLYWEKALHFNKKAPSFDKRVLR